jgi:predicted transcriptional regulator
VLKRLKRVAQDEALIRDHIKEIIHELDNVDQEIRDVVDAAVRLSEMCKSYHDELGDVLAREIDNELVRKLTNILQADQEFSLSEIRKVFEGELLKYNDERTPILPSV